MRSIKILLLFSCLLIIHFSWAQSDDFSFVFFTDAHLNNTDKAITGLTKAVEEINQLSPDFIVQGGDYIFDMNHKEWDSVAPIVANYKQITSVLKAPVYNVLGNHDVVGISKRSSMQPTDLHFGKKNFLQENNQRSYYTFKQHGWLFFVLDGIQHTKNNFTDYSIDKEQMEWITNELAETAHDCPIAIVCHLPLISASAQAKSGGLARNSTQTVLSNSKEVMKLFADYNLKMALAGHLHIFEEIKINKISFVTGGAVCGFWWKGPMGKTAPGFVYVQVKNGEPSVHYIDLN